MFVSDKEFEIVKMRNISESLENIGHYISGLNARIWQLESELSAAKEEIERLKLQLHK